MLRITCEAKDTHQSEPESRERVQPVSPTQPIEQGFVHAHLSSTCFATCRCRKSDPHIIVM